MEQKKIIMVVDDEYDMVDLIQLVLQTEGYDVVTATSGKTALEKLKTEKPDLILLDVSMPDLDGWQVIKKIKENSSLKSIPIIMVTAKAQSTDKIMGLHILNADDYITKPFGRQELLNSVKKHLEASVV